EICEIAFAHAKNSPRTTHPQATFIIFNDLEYFIAEQSLLAGVNRETPVFAAIQATRARADPKIFFRIQMERNHLVVRQAVPGGKAGEGRVFQITQPAIRAEPEAAGIIFTDCADLIPGRTICANGELSVPQAGQSAGGPNPEIS